MKSKSLQVLVATMNSDPIGLFSQMNLHSDAVIANQCQRSSVSTFQLGNYSVTEICTPSRGVGINRNIALFVARSDILLFADDDIIYSDDYVKGVLQAFEKHPDADAIIFGIAFTENGHIIRIRQPKDRRLKPTNSLRYGAAVCAVKREFILKRNIHFSELFGGGALYGSGEDTLFILDLFRNRAKVYSDGYILGRCSKDTSSWFRGYNDKFFYDKGAWIACAFPRIKHIIKWHFIIRFSQLTKKPLFVINRLITKGIQGFSRLEVFSDNLE